MQRFLGDAALSTHLIDFKQMTSFERVKTSARLFLVMLKCETTGRAKPIGESRISDHDLNVKENGL